MFFPFSQSLYRKIQSDGSNEAYIDPDNTETEPYSQKFGQRLIVEPLVFS